MAKMHHSSDSGCKGGTFFLSAILFASANMREKGCFLPPACGEFLVMTFTERTERNQL